MPRQDIYNKGIRSCKYGGKQHVLKLIDISEWAAALETKICERSRVKQVLTFAQSKALIRRYH